MHGPPLKPIAVGLEYISLHAVLCHGVGGEHKPVLPLLDGHKQLHALPGLEAVRYEAAAVDSPLSQQLVGQNGIKVCGTGFDVDTCRDVEDLQALECLLLL